MKTKEAQSVSIIAMNPKNGEILTMVNEAVAAGMTTSAAIRQIASETGVSKNKIYELVHQQEN